MKLHKLGFILLTIVVGLSFTSCDEDYYWKNANLDIKFNIEPDTYDGYDKVYTVVRDVDISGYNPAREEISSIRLDDAWLELSNFKRGDYINKFYIDVEGVGTYPYEWPISIRSDNEVITIDNDSYYYFMEDAINRLAYRGSIKVTVTIYTRIYDGGPIYFDLKNNLSLYIRE